jgi:hypothetical protein
MIARVNNMKTRSHSLMDQDVQPLTQEEIARFRDQFTSMLLQRFLKTLDMQQDEIAMQKREIHALRKSSHPTKRQKNLG